MEMPTLKSGKSPIKASVLDKSALEIFRVGLRGEYGCRIRQKVLIGDAPNSVVIVVTEIKVAILTNDNSNSSNNNNAPSVCKCAPSTGAKSCRC